MSGDRLELVWDRDGGADTPFEALLRAAATDAEAASGLALAYADMIPEARAKLVESVIDGPKRGAAPANTDVLLLLLGVEEEPAIAQVIADALLSAVEDRLPEARRPQRDAAFGWGDPTRGGVGIVRHLHGEFADALRVSWSSDALEAQSLLMTDAIDLDRLRQRTSIPSGAQRVPFEHAVDSLTAALWRHRRSGGEMPAEVRPFAELFSVARRP